MNEMYLRNIWYMYYVCAPLVHYVFHVKSAVVCFICGIDFLSKLKKAPNGVLYVQAKIELDLIGCMHLMHNLKRP